MRRFCGTRGSRSLWQHFTGIIYDQSGVALPVMGAFLAASLGTLALNLDLGRVYAVKGELQRAADAAALAGALRLVTPPSGIAGLEQITVDCNRSQTAGTALTSANPVDAQAADSLQMQVGRWNGQGFTPLGCGAPNDLNAVQATAQKSVPLTFGGLITGSPQLTLSAQAVALTGPVGEMPTGTFPLAIDQSAVPSAEKKWSSALTLPRGTTAAGTPLTITPPAPRTCAAG
jgi:uncharacterized membrane protein